MASYDQLPRKVLIATTMYGHYEAFPGLEKRLDDLGQLFDEIKTCSAQAFPDRNIDVVLLPELAVTGGSGLSLEERCLTYDGQLKEFFTKQAKALGSYITVPMHERGEDDRFYNSALLVNRQGELVDTYRKIFPVIDPEFKQLEGGITPGHRATVFDCDFGKIGLQICYDMTYDDGWQQLAENGTELVGWLTASPQNVKAQKRALDNGYWIVSSTPRNNASIIQPHSGMIHKQITDGTHVLIEEIDLSCLFLHWSTALRNGQAFTEAFGDDVGFTYSEREDCGLFWSNNPKRSIGSMAEELGLLKFAKQMDTCYDLCADKRIDQIQ